jgi:hypothetical protein
MYAQVNSHDLALYIALKSSRINEDLAHTRNPYGSSKWKVPAYHRPYPLCYDYLKFLMFGGYLISMNLVVKMIRPLQNILVYISHSWVLPVKKII